MRRIGIALVAGGIGGLIVLGVGGRVLMRALTITTEEAARFSVEGTLQVIGAGTGWGALTGPMLLAFRQLRPQLGSATGAAFGVAVLLLAFLAVGLIAGFDGGIVAPRAFIAASAVAFPALFVLHGIVADSLAERWWDRAR